MGCMGSKQQVANGGGGGNSNGNGKVPKNMPKKSVNTTKNEQFKSNVEFLRGVPIFYGMQTDAVLTDAAELKKYLENISGI